MSELLVTHAIHVDRPKGSTHPRYPEVIYPLDYGYLENTTASDGGGIDVWLGSLNIVESKRATKTLTGILCTFDTLKRDAEIKLLIGCTEEDVQTIRVFHQEMPTLYVPNPMVVNMNFPEEFRDLLKDDTKAFLYLGTVMSDGSPQVTPVWFSVDGEYILINTAEGRTKDRNMKARPKIAMTIQDPKDPYRYLGIRGEVVNYTREGADEHINALSFKYKGVPYKIPAGQKRIIFRIRPTHFDLHSS